MSADIGFFARIKPLLVAIDLARFSRAQQAQGSVTVAEAQRVAGELSEAIGSVLLLVSEGESLLRETPPLATEQPRNAKQAAMIEDCEPYTLEMNYSFALPDASHPRGYRWERVTRTMQTASNPTRYSHAAMGLPRIVKAGSNAYVAHYRAPYFMASDTLERSTAFAEHRLAGWQRYIRFADTAGLKPSAAGWPLSKFQSRGGLDHASVWRDTTRNLVLLNEPYGPSERMSIFPAACAKWVWRFVLLPDHVSLHNPGLTRSFLAAPPSSKADLEAMAQRLTDSEKTT